MTRRVLELRSVPTAARVTRAAGGMLCVRGYASTAGFVQSQVNE